jgi:hypothetical protein
VAPPDRLPDPMSAYTALVDLLADLGYEPGEVSMLHVEAHRSDTVQVVVEHLTPRTLAAGPEITSSRHLIPIERPA